MLHLCTLILKYDIHKKGLKIQYYYSYLIELQSAPLTYYLCFKLASPLAGASGAFDINKNALKIFY